MLTDKTNQQSNMNKIYNSVHHSANISQTPIGKLIDIYIQENLFSSSRLSI
uniref:Uncharacterized protein n=1 Tax=Rhizophora mucronata TaxID=61149 RepID=A0A2P2Q3T1_RHIMU